MFTHYQRSYTFILVLILPFVLQGQMVQDAFIDHIKTDSGKLFLSIHNQNIFKNNEFFNGIEPGFTTFGSQLNATLKYDPIANLGLEAGIHFLTYYGGEGLDRIRPLFRVQYSPVPELHIVMGQLFGGHNHRYIEPLYRFEQFMEAPPEMGLQVLYNSSFLNSDLFLDWTKYIYRNSYTENESFLLGWNSEFHLTRQGNRLRLSVPLQLLTYHIGGQTDTINLPEQWIGNLATGLSMNYRTQGFIQEIGADLYYLGYKFMRGYDSTLPEKGHAIYPIIYARSKWIDLYLGHWSALNFYAPIGEPIFSSVSRKESSLFFPERSLVILKVDIHFELIKGISLGVRFEDYYDYTGSGWSKNTAFNDYSYGVYITFNRDFFLKQITQYQ